MSLGQSVQQAQLVSQAELVPLHSVTQLALFNADGTPFGGADGNVAAHVAPVTAATAVDLASAEALANANKTTINSLVASLIASGQMAAS